MSRQRIRFGKLAVDIEAFALSNQIVRQPFADREENHVPRAGRTGSESRVDNGGAIRERPRVGKDYFEAFALCWPVRS